MDVHSEDARGGEIEALQQRVAELEQLVRRLAGPAPAAWAPAVPVAPVAPLSRRAFVGRVPVVLAAGVAAAGAGALIAQPAAAAVGDPLLLGQENDPGFSDTVLRTDGPGSTTLSIGRIAIEGGFGEEPGERPQLQVQFADGTYGGAGLRVNAVDAFLEVNGFEYRGVGDDAIRATATGPGAAAIRARNVAGGNPVDPQDSGPAVAASAETDGTAVLAVSDAGRAIAASTTSATTTQDAVVLATAGLGRVLLATATNRSNDRGVVTGVSNGTGAAVWGTQANPSATGAAVVGWAGAAGRGGRFKGGAAAINLAPSTGASHPATGTTGDLVVDAARRLWFCRGGSDWAQLA